MSEPLGRPVSTAKPIIMTFYDYMKVEPYTATFYVPDDTSIEACEELVRAVRALSRCVLSQYMIGHQKFVMPDAREELAALTPIVSGAMKWVVKYWDAEHRTRTHSIPGARPELTLASSTLKSGIRSGDRPNKAHPLWVAFLEVFTRLCVSSQGRGIITDTIVLEYRREKWPCRSTRKRR